MIWSKQAELPAVVRQARLEWLAIFLVFALHGSWPAPDVNEAHYLAKARNFWDAGWIAEDFFLDSADAHAVFYWTCGWLARLLPLPALAWVGRLISWLLLAWSWRRLSWAMVPVPWMATIGAAVFLALLEGCHMAGEWVVGGFEAKGFAYVLLFLALEQLVRGKWFRCLALLGAAGAFHVLVGGWGVIAVAFCWCCSGKAQRPATKELLLGLTVGLLLALPGLIPALALDWGTPRAIVREAAQIQVFKRLPHHLSPAQMSGVQTLRHLTLVVVWLVFAALTPFDPGVRRFRLTVMGAMLTGFAGMGVAALLRRIEPALEAEAMRFYWFRLGDSLGAAGLAIILMAHIDYARRLLPGWGTIMLGASIAIGGTHLADMAVLRAIPQLPRGDRPEKIANFADWRQACRWVEQNTPADARFITPRTSQTFKWHAQRAEVVNWKDMPQDSRHVVEWWQRVRDVHQDAEGAWYRSLTLRTAEELRALGRIYDAGYLLSEDSEILEAELPVLYKNDSYAVYRLE